MKYKLYSWVTSPWFGGIRVVTWAVQILLAIATSLKGSVAYLVFLSLAALVESALTDMIEGWKFKKEDDGNSSGS